MTSRTIKMQLDWQTAAQIIAAALENGTDKGRDAARAELFRMAAILTECQQQPPKHDDRSLDLWEVIAEPTSGTRTAFGQTFHDEAQAAGYARTMRRAGYRAKLSTVFGTQPSSSSALAEAARFFEDASLTEART